MPIDGDGPDGDTMDNAIVIMMCDDDEVAPESERADRPQSAGRVRHVRSDMHSDSSGQLHRVGRESWKSARHRRSRSMPRNLRVMDRGTEGGVDVAGMASTRDIALFSETNSKGRVRRRRNSLVDVKAERRGWVLANLETSHDPFGARASKSKHIRLDVDVPVVADVDESSPVLAPSSAVRMVGESEGLMGNLQDVTEYLLYAYKDELHDAVSIFDNLTS